MRSERSGLGAIQTALSCDERGEQPRVLYQEMSGELSTGSLLVNYNLSLRCAPRGYKRYDLRQTSWSPRNHHNYNLYHMVIFGVRVSRLRCYVHSEY